MADKTITCHDCGKEAKIKDKHDDIDIEELEYCPFCGSNNTEIT